MGARLGRGIALVVLASTLSGCATLEYRRVQQDFTAAVVADNQRSVSPFQAAAAGGSFASIIEDLSPDNIAKKLDARLRPNAWMLRAVSEWRTGAFAEARASAGRGLAEPQLQQHSRDHLVLAMIPALVVDSDLRNRFVAGGGAVDSTAYVQVFEPDFQQAVRTMNEVDALVDASTPEDIVFYARYHRWRILSNWSLTIAGLPFRSPVRDAANAEAASFLGLSIEAAANAARDGIPTSHPLRQFITSEGG